MVPKHLVVFELENCMKSVQDGERSLIRFREEGGSKRHWGAFECTKEGMENL